MSTEPLTKCEWCLHTEGGHWPDCPETKVIALRAALAKAEEALAEEASKRIEAFRDIDDETQRHSRTQQRLAQIEEVAAKLAKQLTRLLAVAPGPSKSRDIVTRDANSAIDAYIRATAE